MLFRSVGLGFVEEEKEKEGFMKDARAPQAKKTPQDKKANISRTNKLSIDIP